jgi:addiction module HigA family antidote
MTKNNPVHPGEILRQDCLPALHMTIVAAAKALGVSRQQVHRLMNGTCGITPEMAIRLSQVFGGTAETWMNMQVAYDLAQIRARDDIHLGRGGEAA